MRRSRTLRLGLLTALLLTWCAVATAQDIRYNYMPGTDFSKYKTYKWVRVPKAQYPNSILDEQIMQAIDAQLSAKGLTKTEENPDLYVTYQVAVNQETQWNSFSSGGDWGWGGWRGWGGMSTTTTTSQTINVGTLSCDMYDVALKKQVWRGDATKTLGSGKDPEKVRKNLNKAMAKLFKKYPPPPKS